MYTIAGLRAHTSLELLVQSLHTLVTACISCRQTAASGAASPVGQKQDENREDACSRKGRPTDAGANGALEDERTAQADAAAVDT